jgi:PAS domain S-box-containing protein
VTTAPPPTPTDSGPAPTPDSPELHRLLAETVDDAVRLLGADGGMLSLLDPVTNELVRTHESGADAQGRTEWRLGARIPATSGLFGHAIAERGVVATGDYAADRAFEHDPGADALVRASGLRSMIVAPLIADGTILGALGVFATQPDAFGSAALALARVLADHAAIAITNDRLIRELDRSRAHLAERAATERALREISGRLVTIREPGEMLQRVVDEAGRLVGADGTILSLIEDDGVLHWRYDDGLQHRFEPDYVRDLTLEIGVGVTGRAVQERRPIIRNHDLLNAFPRSPESDHFFEVSGFMAMIGAPIVGESGPLGALEVYARREGAFDEDDAAVIAAFADQAAIAITNARLIQELDRSRAQVRESEAKYRYLVENSPDVVFSADATATITYLSETSEALLGWRPDELIGKPFFTIIHPESADFMRRQYGASLGLPESRELRYRLVLKHRDGSRVPVEMVGRTIVENGAYAGSHGSVRDTRERDRLERDLQRQAADLAAGEERAHLARELHDSVTQALFSMTLMTRSIEVLLARDPSLVADRLATLRDLQRDALAEMRALIFELRPASLEHDGLLAAIRTHAAAVQARTGLPVTVESDGAERLAEPVETALFRIVQEALHNVVKHAGAHNVRVILRQRPGVVRLAVHDDGAGFDPAKVSGDHLGLAGMRARAEKLGGRLEVHSELGHGTEIRAELPIAVE